MKAYVLNDVKLIQCLYSIFNKDDLIKYINEYIKRYPTADHITIVPECPDSHNYLAPSVNIFSLDTKISFPRSSLKLVHVYDENGWNPYPTILPPDTEGQYSEWLVQLENGDMKIAYFYGEYGPSCVIKSWHLTKRRGNDIIDKVIAFRKLPKRYK